MADTTNTESVRDEQVADGMRHLIGAQANVIRAIQAVLESKRFASLERVLIIHLIASVGALGFDRELSVGETIAHFGMSGRTVRGTLHRLTESGAMITTVRVGRPSLYRIDYDKLLAFSQEGG